MAMALQAYDPFAGANEDFFSPFFFGAHWAQRKMKIRQSLSS